MNRVRRQLSLYVPDEAAAALEAVRRLVDPVQSRLIPAHVTLCREAELGDFPGWNERFSGLRCAPVTLVFGRPELFAGHGLLLNCIQGEAAFRALREQVLRVRSVREQSPHITLAHPRNPKYGGGAWATASRLPDRLEITFRAIHVIEQTGQEPWQSLHCLELVD